MRTRYGVLLAAGAGTRMGTPKALVRDPDGRPWLLRGVQTLLAGGCDRVLVVLGAAADEAERLLAGAPDPAAVDVVRAADWADGMAASLRAALDALDATHATTAVVHLVDLPDVTAEVVRRVVAAGDDPALVARAAYDGRPGHPVLLGRDHWAPLRAVLNGDRGARDYLAAHPTRAVECGDLATGRDQDQPPPLTL